VDVLSDIAAAEGAPTQKVRDAVRTFAARAMRGRRLAYGLIFEPIDPEVESTRLQYRRAIAEVFAAIIREGIAAGEFRDQDVDVASACVVGAFMEGLIGSLAPDTRRAKARADEIAREIANLCLAAVAHPDNPALRMRPPQSASTEPSQRRPHCHYMERQITLFEESAGKPLVNARSMNVNSNDLNGLRISHRGRHGVCIMQLSRFPQGIRSSVTSRDGTV
jgi:Tetracyclin repressor-like, C-terminal domain